MIQPILENVLVKPLGSSNVSNGGLVIPDSCKRISNKVQIIAVGNGSEKNPMKLKPGQVGYRVKNWGDEIQIDGEIYYIMNQKAIIALD